MTKQQPIYARLILMRETRMLISSLANGAVFGYLFVLLQPIVGSIAASLTAVVLSFGAGGVCEEIDYHHIDPLLRRHFNAD